MAGSDVRGGGSTAAAAAAAAVSAATSRCFRRHSLVLLLSLFGLLHLVALGLFARGFFLTRFELTVHQSCELPPHTTQGRQLSVQRMLRQQQRKRAAGGGGGGPAVDDSDEQDERPESDDIAAAAAAVADPLLSLEGGVGIGDGGDGSRWFPRQYDAVIMLVVDALRFDFLLTNSTAVEEEQRRREEEAAGEATADGGYADPSLPWPAYSNGLPIAESLLSNSSTSSHTALYRFEADAPTVTMQRLKGLTTGSLPTFIDIKDNFASSKVEEDNWVWQLTHNSHHRRSRQRQHLTTSGSEAGVVEEHSAGSEDTDGGRLLFFGDDTWADLFPPSVHMARGSAAYPSFDVQDLHTVDRGCRKGLTEALKHERARLQHEEGMLDPASTVTSMPSSAQEAEPSTGASAPTPTSPRHWDVLLAHFLGVDHVGHRFGPSHVAMRAKLAETNEAIAEQVNLLTRQRELNARLRAERNRRAKMTSEELAALPPLPREQQLLLLVLGDHGMTAGGNHGGQSDEEIYAGLLVYSTRRVAPTRVPPPLPATDTEPPSSTNAATTFWPDEGRMLEELRASVLSDYPSSSSSTSSFALPPLSPLATSWRTIPQIDLVPTLSLLLGLPIPFGSLGTVALELFWGRDDAADDDGTDDGGGDQLVDGRAGGSDADMPALLMRRRIRSFLPLLRALRVNALQLMQYLSVYSAMRDSSVRELFAADEGEAQQLDTLFALSESAWEALSRADPVQALRRSSDAERPSLASELPSLRALESLCLSCARAHYAFLNRAARVAKQKWTVFDTTAMAQGLVLLAALVLVRVAYAANEALHARWQQGVHAQMQQQLAHSQSSNGAGFSNNHSHPRSKIFAHPSLALAKLLALLLVALAVPLVLCYLLLSWTDDVTSAIWVRDQGPFILASAMLLAAAATLARNVRARLRHATAAAEERQLPQQPGRPSPHGFFLARQLRSFCRHLLPSLSSSSSWPPSFAQFALVLVLLLYVQGLFSNSFIVAEGGVVLYAAAMIAGSGLWGLNNGSSDDSEYPPTEPSARPSASLASATSSSSWGNVLRVLVTLSSLRLMQWGSYSTAPDCGFQDEDKFAEVEVMAMIAAIVAIPVAGAVGCAALLRRYKRQQKREGKLVRAGTLGLDAGVATLVHFVLIPLGCLCILLFWTLHQPAPTGTGSSDSATASTPADAAAAGPSFVRIYVGWVSAAFAALLSVLGAESGSAIVRLGLPRAVYALSTLGILCIVAIRRTQQAPAEGADAIRTGRRAQREDNGAVAAADGEDSGSESESDDDALLNTTPDASSRRRTDASVDGVARARKRTPVASHSDKASENAVDGAMQRHVRAGSANTLKKADATDPSLFALRVFSLAQLCVLPLLLLWGPKSSVLLVCLWAIMLCVLSFRHEQATPPSARSSSGGSSLSEQSFLFFLSAHLFCCTGHSSSSFSSLQISAAFLGLEGFGFYASGALLALNTFGAQILGVLLVALLDALRRVQATSGSELTASAASSAAKKTKQHAVAITTVVPPPPPSSFPASLHLFSLLFLCRSVCSVLNVALQRRHLMVWAIFAPKFLFDAVAGVIVELAVMLVAAACTRWTTHSV